MSDMAIFLLVLFGVLFTGGLIAFWIRRQDKKSITRISVPSSRTSYQSYYVPPSQNVSHSYIPPVLVDITPPLPYSYSDSDDRKRSETSTYDFSSLMSSSSSSDSSSSYSGGGESGGGGAGGDW